MTTEYDELIQWPFISFRGIDKPHEKVRERERVSEEEMLSPPRGQSLINLVHVFI